MLHVDSWVQTMSRGGGITSLSESGGYIYIVIAIDADAGWRGDEGNLGKAHRERPVIGSQLDGRRPLASKPVLVGLNGR